MPPVSRWFLSKLQQILEQIWYFLHFLNMEPSMFEKSSESQLLENSGIINNF